METFFKFIFFFAVFVFCMMVIGFFILGIKIALVFNPEFALFGIKFSGADTLLTFSGQ